ncbi:MAG TPA: Ig-like domain-containing protein [Verrucomicrobiales bacterium]|nr:Ig-like domain-containing protein [Verrucomicrobiales bacterium]
MSCTPMTHWRAIFACLLVPSLAFAAPVAVNDSYAVNEDGILNTAGADIISANFEPAANVLSGPWQFLDKIKNSQNGQTADTYPVDGASRDWKVLAFDTATSTVGPWGSGAMPLQGGGINGLPGAPETLTGYSVGGANYTITTYLFRKTFTLDANAAAATQWTLRHLVDDAAIFYVNGQEVFRTNFDPGQYTPTGPVTTNTYANTSLQDENTYTTSAVTIPAGLLTTGTNIMAIELHQGGQLTSTDVGIDCTFSPSSTSSGGLVYLDDPFGTNRPNNASGTLEAATGNPGGAIVVDVGHSTTAAGAGFSGGWRRTFTLGAPAVVRFAFQHRIGTRGGLEPEEYGAAVMDLDGTRYGTVGTAPALFLGQLAGSGNGQTDQDTAWVPVSMDLPLSAGSHTLTLGGYCNSTSQTTEFAFIWFDNVTVSSLSSGNGILANDTGGAVTAQLVANPTHGALALNPNGNFSYTPAANYFGPDSFTYRALDAASAQSNVATVNLTVTSVNDAPVAVTDSYSTNQQQTLTVNAANGVLANDTDADNTPAQLSATVVTNVTAAQGALTFNSNGSFTFVPAAAFSGPASFIYRVTDGTATADGTVNLNVISVGNSPVAVADNYTTPINAPLVVTALVAGTTTDDVIPYGSAQVPSVWKYLDNGSDQGVAWRATSFNDAAWKSGGAELGYGNGDEVTAVEDNATPGYVQGETDRFATTYFRRFFDITNKFDIAAASLSIIYDDGAVIFLNGSEFTRTVTMPSAATAPDVAFDFYTASNSSNNATETFPLPVASLLDGPNLFAVELHQTTPSSSDISFNLRLRLTRNTPASLLANDTDSDPGTTLTISSNTNPSHGTLSLNPNGTFTYTPAVGYLGADSFTYRCTDGTLISAPVTVNLTVVPGPNVRPVANGDTYAATEDTTLNVPAATGVLANDTDADGDPRTAVLVTPPASGTLTLNSNGSFAYTPAQNFAGPITFTYSANDAGGPSVAATVTINVANVNDAPSAVNDVYATDPGVSLIVSTPGLLSNDTDPDAGANLTAQLVAGPAQGTLTLNPNGSFNYAPPAAFTGTVTFTYRANDGTANSGNATVTVKVNGRPVSNANTYAATEDTVLTVSAPGVLGNDTDPENDPLTAQITTQPAHGTLSLAANGGFTFTPASNYNGPDSFTYKAFDGVRDSLTAATVTVNIASVNDVPQAVIDAYATPQDTLLTVPAATGVLGNDTDVDGQTLSAVLNTGTTNGALSLNTDGSFLYTPNAGFSGIDTFTYRATDGVLSSPSVTVSINVGIDFNKIVINEIHYHPQSLNAAEEFIEIRNGNPGPVNVSGWQLNAGVTYTMPAGTTIAGNGYLVVAASPATFTATFGSVSLLRGPWIGQLSNSGENIRLVTATGEEVDEVEYSDEGDWAERRQVNMGQTSWEWYTRSDALGSSLELINPAMSGKNGQNWTWSTAAPTPGNANSVAATDIAPLITDLQHRPQIPTSADAVTVSVRVADEALTPPAVSLFWRVSAASPAAFTQAPMFDDGAHGDGDANDGEYGAIIDSPAAKANGTVVEFYVSATDAGNKTRTWPPAGRNLAGTAYLQTANAFYQVDEEVWANHYPIYRLIGTAADVALFLGSWDRNSDAQFNVTLVSKQGNDFDVRYRCGLRVRGAGSRGNSVNNWRLNIPKDNPWNDETEANLNIWHPHLGDLGSRLMESAGLIHERSWPVQVRLNATNRALSNSQYSAGYYIHLLPTGSEYLDELRPEDSQGNLYKKARPHQDWTMHEASAGGPPSASGYRNDGWIKSTNEDLNDWNDIHGLMKVFSNANPTVAQMESVMNVDYWLRWQALQTIINHNETNISNGAGDDYSMYRGAIDPRFIPLAHDYDTILGDGGNTSGLDPTQPNATIYQVTGNFSSGETTPALAPLFTNPVMNQRFKAQLVDLLNTVFLPANFNPFVDATIGDWTGPTPAYGVPAAKITAIKNFNAARRTHILQTVLGYSAGGTPPAAVTVTTSLTSQNGYPRTTSANVTGLSGTVDSSRVQKLRINGTDIFPDNFNSIGNGEGGNGPSPWSAGAAITLKPGINNLVIQALGPNDALVGSQTIALWFDDASVQAVASIAGNTTWTAAGGPYRVTANLAIDNETLTIEPGTTVYVAPGISLNVTGTGRILAEGTADAPIRFMREPGVAGTWGRLSVSGSTLETRMAWVTVDGAGTSPAISLATSTGFFDHISFANVAVQYFGSTNASFVFSNSTFPATTGVRAAGGTGIPAAGYAIFRGNTFGGATGLNDLIEFTGGQRPNAILQVLDNTFLAASDDALDLDGTDAHIEGNVFLNVHQTTAGTDTAAAIAGGADSGNTSELTIVRNLFWNCDHAVLATNGNFYTVVNNTIVNINNTGSAAGSSAGAFKFNEPGRAGVTGALGMLIDGNIVVDSAQVFENAANATGSITANRNMLPAAIAAPVTGTANLTSSPMLTATTGITAANIYQMYALQSGSPAWCTGPNFLDRGGLVPAGASISGEPIAVQPSQSVVLTISGPGITEYRYSLDGGAFGAATPVATPVTLTGLTAGTHSIRAVGRNSAGVWQADAAATQSLTWTVSATAQPVVISEILADNVNAWPVGALRPDFIELRNLSGTVINLSGWSISDDPMTAEVPAKYIFPGGTVIPANGYLLLNADTLGFNLSSEGDEVFLYGGSFFGSALIDSVSFGFQIADKSISRVCNDQHWALGEPTPGTINTPAQTGSPAGLRINEWLGSNDFIVDDDFLELYNSFTLPVDLGGIVITDDAINYPQQNPIAPLSFIAANGFVHFHADGNADSGPNHLNFSISKLREGLDILSDGVVIDHVISAPQLPDISQGRTTDGSAGFSLFTLPTPGYSNSTNLTAQQLVMDNIRITELHYNPSGGSNAPEYIELKNISTTQTIDISAVKFVNGITFQFAPGTTLAPGAFTVITSATQAAYTALYPNGRYGGTYSGKLDNGGERVRMEIDGYQLGILDFDYSDSWYPVTDGSGAALEIVNPLAVRTSWGEKVSWRATAPNPGFSGVFGVIAGEDVTVTLPGSASLEASITYGPQSPGSVTLQWTKVSGPGSVTFGTPTAAATTAGFSAFGNYVLRLTATGSSTVFDEILVSASESYDAWAARTLGSSDPLVIGMTRDPDRDGLQNLLEYALGLNPASGSGAGLPTVTVTGGFLTLTYQRYTGSGVNYIVEVSNDLNSWSSTSVTENMTSASGTLQTWSAVDTVPVANGKHRYMRVRVVGQ